VGFGITSKVGVGLASGSRIGIQGANAVGRNGATFGRQLRTRFTRISVAAKVEVSLATIDGISIAAGGVTREAIKQGFVISVRREAIQQIIQQGIKEATINSIIKTTTKILVK